MLKLRRACSLMLILIGGCLVLTATSAAGESLWSNEERTGFTDNVAVEEGDIVMIVVSENSSANSENAREREKDVEVGGQANENSGDATVIHEVASWIPIFGATISGGSEYESEREMDASNSLNTRMSVRVEDVSSNDVLKLRGKRKLKLDDEVKNLSFVGYARAQDVRPDNTIPSDRIANAKIFYEGELGLKDGEARGLLGKSWKFFKNVLFW